MKPILCYTGFHVFSRNPSNFSRSRSQRPAALKGRSAAVTAYPMPKKTAKRYGIKGIIPIFKPILFSLDKHFICYDNSATKICPNFNTKNLLMQGEGLPGGAPERVKVVGCYERQRNYTSFLEEKKTHFRKEINDERKLQRRVHG
jgi:hypothetical protein